MQCFLISASHDNSDDAQATAQLHGTGEFTMTSQQWVVSEFVAFPGHFKPISHCATLTSFFDSEVVHVAERRSRAAERMTLEGLSADPKNALFELALAPSAGKNDGEPDGEYR